MVDCSQIVCNFFCSLQVWWTLLSIYMQTSLRTREALVKLFFNSIQENSQLTSKPTQNEWSWAPHCLAALVPAKCLAVMEATKEESKPPESSTPNGTSVINLLITACMYHTQQISESQNTISHLCIWGTEFVESYILKSPSESKRIIWVWWNGLGEPWRIVPTPQATFFARVQVTRWEGFKMFTVII